MCNLFLLKAFSFLIYWDITMNNCDNNHYKIRLLNYYGTRTISKRVILGLNVNWRRAKLTLYWHWLKKKRHKK